MAFAFSSNTSNVVMCHPSASICMTMARVWLEKNTTNAVHPQSLSTSLTELKHENETNIPKNKYLEIAKSDYFTAFKQTRNVKHFQKHIQSAYNQCCSAKSIITGSYDKIFIYSLLISAGFIYHSDFGDDNLNGLKQIYHILCEMNNDIQLRKDLNTALSSVIFWRDFERKLINASVHFAIRTNIFIQRIQNCTETNRLHKKDMLYLDIGWIPRYYDGYYFGKTGRNCKYRRLCTKDLRNAMNANKAPNRIQIDDLIIHTFDLGNTGLYIQRHKEYIHHWYSDADWIDFCFVNMFMIFVQMVNNGKVYELKVNLYDTVRMIKMKICRMEGDVSSVMMRMEYNNKRLQDDRTLYDYHISKDCWLKASLLTFNPFLNLVS